MEGHRIERLVIRQGIKDRFDQEVTCSCCGKTISVERVTIVLAAGQLARVTLETSDVQFDVTVDSPIVIPRRTELP